MTARRGQSDLITTVESKCWELGSTITILSYQRCNFLFPGGTYMTP